MNNCDCHGIPSRHAYPNICPIKDTEQVVAMAYVPWQYFHDVYDPDKALMCGTIFPELNKPFLGKRGACR